MFYEVQALHSPFEVCEYNPHSPVVTFLRTRRRPDVRRAAYRFLLMGHWVRVVDEQNGLLLSGPFDPKLKLPHPETVLPLRPVEEEK